VTWENCIECIFATCCSDDELCKVDAISGLYPCLLAAAHGTCKDNNKTSDLDTIYNLICADPNIL